MARTVLNQDLAQQLGLENWKAIGELAKAQLKAKSEAKSRRDHATGIRDKLTPKVASEVSRNLLAGLGLKTIKSIVEDSIPDSNIRKQVTPHISRVAKCYDFKPEAVQDWAEDRHDRFKLMAVYADYRKSKKSPIEPLEKLVAKMLESGIEVKAIRRAVNVQIRKAQESTDNS